MAAEAVHVTHLVRLSSVTLCAIVAAHTLLETARDTLFLQRIPVAELPWMYAAVAALSLLLVFAPPLRGANRWVALPLMLTLASAGTLVFWALASSPSRGGRLYYALYIWTALCATTVVTQFWTTTARIFTLGEANRLFAKIGIGAVLGSSIGAGLARLLFLFTTARTLVLLAAVGFALSAGLAVFLRPEPSTAPKETRTEMRAARVVWDNPYLVVIGELSIAMAFTATVVDYAFKRIVVHHYGASEIGPIVSTMAFVSNALGGIFQIYFVPRILAAVGTARSLRLLPATLTLGALAGVVVPAAIVGVGLRAIDGVFRYSLQRTATELLFVPVSETIRGKVKQLLDVVTKRGGQGLASLGLLLVPAAMHSRFYILAVGACSAVWFLLALRVAPAHLSVFREMVQEGALADLRAAPVLDQASVEALVAALSNGRDEPVLFALEMLSDRGKTKLIPTLILFHPSPAVVIQALEIFGARARTDAADLTWRLVDHADPNVRMQALHTASALAFDANRVRALLPRDDLGGAALVELWARGAEREEEVARVSALLSPSGDPVAQQGLLRALSITRSPRLLRAALPLAERASAEVQIQIARAVELDPMIEAMPALLPMLAHWATREAARRAMVSIGLPALSELARAMRDPASPPFLRVHAPRSISRFAPDAAVPLLLDLVLHHPEGVVRFKALRGLGRLVADGAVARPDDAALLRFVERDVTWSSRTLDWSERLRRAEEGPTPRAREAGALLRDLLYEKGANAGERIFRAVALRYRGENWERIFDGFRAGRWEASREIVLGVLREPLRGRVLDLIDRSAEQRRAPPPETRDEPLAPLLREIVEAEDEVLSAVAAYYATQARRTSAPRAPDEEVAHAIRSAS